MQQKPGAAISQAAARPLSESWQGLVSASASQQQEAAQREEKQLAAYLSWLENAEGKKGVRDVQSSSAMDAGATNTSGE
jgi:hypothetical protein